MGRVYRNHPPVCVPSRMQVATPCSVVPPRRVKCTDFDHLPRPWTTQQEAAHACPVRVRVGHDPLTVRGKRRMAVTEVIQRLRAAHLAVSGRHVEQVVSITALRRASPGEQRAVVAPGVVRHHSRVEQQAQTGTVGFHDVQPRELPAAPSQRCMNTNRSPAASTRRDSPRAPLPISARGYRPPKGQPATRRAPRPPREIEPPDPVPIRRLICGEIAHIHAVPVLGLDEREAPVVERQRNSPSRVHRLNRPGTRPLAAVRLPRSGRRGPSMRVVEDRASTPSSMQPLRHASLLEVPGGAACEHLDGCRAAIAQADIDRPRVAAPIDERGRGGRRGSRAQRRSIRRSIPSPVIGSAVDCRCSARPPRTDADATSGPTAVQEVVEALVTCLGEPRAAGSGSSSAATRRSMRLYGMDRAPTRPGLTP